MNVGNGPSKSGTKFSDKICKTTPWKLKAPFKTKKERNSPDMFHFVVRIDINKIESLFLQVKMTQLIIQND